MRGSPVILLNYAIALSHVGRIVEASEIYRSLARDAEAPGRLRAEASHAVTELEPRFGRILLRVTGSLDDVSLTLDGAAVASSMANVAVPGDPGDHVIEAHRAGEVIATAHVHVESGQTGTTELVVPAPPRVEVPSASIAARELETPTLTTIPADAPPIEHHEVYEEWWFWTLISVAVIGAAVGIGVGVATSSPTTVLPSGSLGTIDGR